MYLLIYDSISFYIMNYARVWEREREAEKKKIRPPSSGIATSPSSCSLKSLDVIKKKGCLRTNRPRGPEAMQLV